MNSTKKIILIIFLAIIAAIFSSLTGPREFVTRLFSTNNNQRKILSKIFLNFDGNQFIAFKVKTDDGLELEIYEKDHTSGFQSLKRKFSYPKDKDAYLIVEGNSVNLATSDIDNDNNNEIIMPTVDQFGVSRLNIIKYNLETKQFSQSLAEE